MTKIFTNIFSSLDGVVDADSDWQYPFFDEELFQWVSGAWDRAAAVLLGRPSFEGYEQLRAEHPDSPVLAFLDQTPTFVVSDKIKGASRSGVEIIRQADVLSRVATLRQENDGDILVLGSPGLLRRLVERNVVDELNIMVLPVIVGTGTRLFSGDSEIRWQRRGPIRQSSNRLLDDCPGGRSVDLPLVGVTSSGATVVE